MSAFTPRNWNLALASVFERAMRDPDFRTQALNDPAAAMKAVSDIELPPTLKFRFIDNRSEMVYTYILPPAQPTAAANAEATSSSQLKALIDWATVCSDPTCEDVAD